MRRLVLFALLLAGCDFLYTVVYEPYFCVNDSPCNDKDHHGRICVYDGKTGRYCADPDSSCPSGYRFGSKLANIHSSECVDPQNVPGDGGSDGPDAAVCNANGSGG